MNDKDTVGSGPLAGLRVLDLTQFLAGPYATMIFADLGAEVIKLEAPVGDWSRVLPPNFVGEDSCYYLSINRNKKSIVVDMKNEDGLELVRRLAEKSDFLVENFRPGVLDRLGLTYEALSKRNPELIWASISGFGQTGSDRDRPAYDMIVQAISGGMGMTGEPGRSAVRSGIPIGDLSAGMYAVIGALAALRERSSSGLGQYIDISMLDCQVSMLCYQAAYYLHSGKNPGRQGWGHDSIPTYRGFNCAKATSLVITANTERMWQGLCDVLGIAEMKDDPRFVLNEDRYKNRNELWPILEGAFMMHKADHWVPLLLEAGIPVGEINNLEKALSNPQIVGRDMVLPLKNDDGDEIKVAGNPIKMSRAPNIEHRYPPKLGAQTSDILEHVLGADKGEIANLVRCGAVKEFTPKHQKEG
ncbi:MAG: Acetyl-CoA:oxalate CoA-transferase [Alphaproteobacteria bacterium MarineAlpha11_Bin1]|nr:MAG: Acetyl-CoA:oxalate CoA-transferase [Alphaproteobacteria bacterium MarineAlpha11_Bin1]|tara:strand:- start:8359 stop:9603 length:1245 start_codon:yes stop_codon:yes gene_type:complete